MSLLADMAPKFSVELPVFVCETGNSFHTIQYTYDALSRLLNADYYPGLNTAATPFRTYEYGYDLAGNLTNMDGVTRTYNAANQLTNDGTNTLAYDNNGNLTRDGANVTYTYDRANRLVSVGDHSYTYDGTSARIRQTVDSVVTEYLLDVQPELVKVIASTTGGNTERYLHGPRGIHAIEDASGNWLYPAQDGLGSVRMQLSADLTVDGMQHYEPYGDPFGLQGDFDSPFGFTGEYTDANGLSYLRARYYNPDTGTFASLDPFEGMIDEPLSLNGYAYAHGNPVNYTDPSGEVLNVVAAVVGAITSPIGIAAVAVGATACWYNVIPGCKEAVFDPISEALGWASKKLSHAINKGICEIEEESVELIEALERAMEKALARQHPGGDPGEEPESDRVTVVPPVPRLDPVPTLPRPTPTVMPSPTPDNCDGELTPPQAARAYARIARHSYYDVVIPFDPEERPPITIAVTRAKDQRGRCAEIVSVSNATGGRYITAQGTLSRSGRRAMAAMGYVARIAVGRGARTVGVTSSLVEYIAGVQGHAETNLYTAVSGWGQASSLRAMGISQPPCLDCDSLLHALRISVAYYDETAEGIVDFQ